MCVYILNMQVTHTGPTVVEHEGQTGWTNCGMARKCGLLGGDQTIKEDKNVIQFIFLPFVKLTVLCVITDPTQIGMV